MNPYVVRHILLPLHERLLRRRTFRYYHDLEQSQWWATQKLRQLQLEKLRRLVSLALNKTAIYADLAGVDRCWLPESLEDLQRLPLLDKSIISAHREELVNRDVRGGPIRYNTGGSTGQPLIFYFDKRRQAYDKAARMRTHRWWGVEPGEKEAYIWGSPIELRKQDRLKQIRDWLTNELLLSAFDLSEQSIGWYVARLRRFKPKCLFGYPSSIALLCQLARRAGLDLAELPVKVIFCTAEVLYDHQRRIISETFGGIPVVNGYGSREGGFIAHECPEGRMHITSENVIVEIIKDNRPAKPREDGEIVITHLDNYAMPFIRYRTGDIGQPSNETCPCGRGLEVMKVVKGRSTDFIIAPDGRWVHGSAFGYVLRDIPGVLQYQIIQEDVDSIRILIVINDDFPPNGVEQIRESVVARLGSDVQVDVEQVSEITPDPSGKFRYVISWVARDRSMALGLEEGKET